MSHEKRLKIGVLTGGGDCPGLNAVIRAVVRRAVHSYGFEVFGFRDGWKGLIEGRIEPLSSISVTGILRRGGTILGTSRTNPRKKQDHLDAIVHHMKKYEIDALIPIGGDDTLGVALWMHGLGFQVVGVPKTIDNDIKGTDYTFGFNTAVETVTEALDKLQTTAESHHRIMVVEVMGRHAGWIATMAGIAGGADEILIPEMPFDIEDVVARLMERHKRRSFSIVVVAEGAVPKDGGMTTISDKKDAFGHVMLGGIGQWVSDEIEKRTGCETRYTNLGHIQRGGIPTAYDRILSTRFGVAAVDAVANGERGKMVALRSEDIILIPLEDAVLQNKVVNPEFYEIASLFF
ncbi:MAG: 6-phosphofructokinase [bacterium]|nr:6-phosphofructokinase [bacterium]